MSFCLVRFRFWIYMLELKRKERREGDKKEKRKEYLGMKIYILYINMKYFRSVII